jgi:Acetyltransferase (GNAT) family
MFERVDRDAGIRAGVALWNLEYPDYLNTEEEHHAGFRHNPPDAPEVHLVAYEQGEPIGSISLENHGEERPIRHFEGEFVIRPDRMKEVVPEVLQALREVKEEFGVEYISVWCNDRFPERTAILKDAGLEIIQTVPGSRLDLDSFDPTPFKDKVEAVAQKFRLVTAADLDAEGFDWIPGLWETSWEIAEDIPGPHQRSRPPLDEYRQRIRNETIFYQPETMMMALDGEKIVGYSRVTLSDAMPELALTGMSGALRTHRRQGIVTALKVLGIDKMKAKGIRWLQTDNDETNPMYQINLRLGFRLAWTWHLWKLT